MSILDNLYNALKGTKPLPDFVAGGEPLDLTPRVSNVTYGQDIYEAFGVNQAGVTVTATSAMRVAAVYACVGKIAGAISTLPLNIYARKDAEGCVMVSAKRTA